MTETQDPRSLFNLFAEQQETFEEAKKKSSEESSKKAKYFRIQKDGTYPVRILPLAPVLDAQGNPQPMERKGYEYPIRSLMLKIEDPGKTEKGKPHVNYVTVCNAKYVFGERLDRDLIDIYVETACNKYSDDEKLCKVLKSNSFSGGLKWDSKRCMYVYDIENPSDGIQILQLSYAQYKDLEERKLNLWAKLNKNGKNKPCPISSINNAYPVEITRKNENGKATYSFNIDTVSEVNVLTEDELTELLDTPRLPEVLYRYTRFHLEATVVYLRQLDEKYDIEVVDEQAVQDCIEQVKMLLPADDNSHFSMDSKSSGSKGTTIDSELDALFARYEELEEAGIDDKSEEGQGLKASIREFIDKWELDLKVSRAMTNADLLNSIDELVNDGVKADDETADDSEPELDTIEEDIEELDEEPEKPVRRPQNEDTNEPAIQPGRRGDRPRRRR